MDNKTAYDNMMMAKFIDQQNKKRKKHLEDFNSRLDQRKMSQLLELIRSLPNDQKKLIINSIKMNRD